MKLLFPFISLFLLDISAYSQNPGTTPWFLVNGNSTRATRFDKTCRFPSTIMLENKELKLPADFSGSYEVDYIDGSKIKIEGDNCWSSLFVSDVNERKGYRTNYIIEPTVLVIDTMYLESPDPPYDLQMMVIERFTFKAP